MNVTFTRSKRWVVEKEYYLIPTIVIRTDKIENARGLRIKIRFLNYWAQWLFTWKVKQGQ